MVVIAAVLEDVVAVGVAVAVVAVAAAAVH